tara:strand:+ start:2903 stop:4330 length:1428 start_codon:yes stop_codon:yes gene_type:complete
LLESVNHKIFRLIGACADELGLETYVVGGYVRDAILKRGEAKDIDIVAVGSGIELAQAVAKKLGSNRVNVFKSFGTAQVITDDIEIEFVGARKESYDRNSRKPSVENGTLDDDQKRRDFTINALAICLNDKRFGELIDPFNGIEDLENKIIRTPLEPDQTFSDDPLRMMRAIRFATQLDFQIEESCLASIKSQNERLKIISVERISTELNKIMATPKPSKGLILLYRTHLLKHFLPEVTALAGVEEIEGQSHKDNFYHTAIVVDNLAATSDKLWLRYAALFHDIGKPVTKRFVPGIGWTFHSHEFVGGKMLNKIFNRMKFPLGEPLRYVKKIVQLSSRPQSVVDDTATDSAARRLLIEAGDDVDDLMLLCEADITTRNKKKKEQFLENFRLVRKKLVEVEEKDHLRNFQPPIGGEEIMRTFNLKPGPQIGELKKAIKDAILDGEIENDYEQAYAFALNKATTMGLKPIIENDQKA